MNTDHLDPIHPGEILIEDFLKPLGAWVSNTPSRCGEAAFSAAWAP